jgi:hypothetical protein
MQIAFSFLPIILPLLLLYSLLILLGINQVRRQGNLVFWGNVLWFVFPLIFAICGGILSPNEFNVRYTSLSFPSFVLFMIAGIKCIKYKWIRNFIVGIIIFLSIFSLNNHFFNERYHKENNRAAGQFLTTHAIPDDIVICSAGYTYQMLSHYYKGNDIKVTGYPVEDLYVQPKRLEADIRKIIAGRNRFWLFLSRTFHSDPSGYLLKYCDEKFQRELNLKNSGVELILYTNTTNKSS